MYVLFLFGNFNQHHKVVSKMVIQLNQHPFKLLNIITFLGKDLLHDCISFSIRYLINCHSV